MRLLRQMSYDDECCAAAVLSLAVKGRLKITEEKTGLLGFGRQFTLHKNEPLPTNPALSADEAALFDALLGTRESLVLEQKNHMVLRLANVAHQKSLDQQYKGQAFKDNSGWHLAGLVIAVVFGVIAVGLLSLFYVIVRMQGRRRRPTAAAGGRA